MQLISSLANLFTPSREHVSYPFAKILVNGVDVTSNIMPLLIDLTIEDAAGFESDSITINLANPKGNIFVPQKGAMIAVMLGYKKSAMLDVGLYELGNIKLQGGAGGHTMTLTGKAAFFSKKSIKSPKNKSYDEKTIKDIVEEVAGEAGMNAAVDQKLGAIKIKHIDQSNESGMNFLSRLAKDYDAIFKVAQQKIIFAQRGMGLSVGGSAMQSMQINLTPKISYSLETDDKEAFDKVTVYYHDKKKGGREKVEKGEGENTYEHKRTLPTKEEAEKKAESLLNQKARSCFKLELTMAGVPSLTAETPVVIIEPSIPLINGIWIIEKVTHKLKPTGFTTTIQCYPNTAEAKAKLKAN